eukprot:jgi/Hompol1/5279/HPOL_004302-RA
MSNALHKKKAIQLALLERLEGRPLSELVVGDNEQEQEQEEEEEEEESGSNGNSNSNSNRSSSKSGWLVVLNASYDSGISGAQLEEAFADCAGFDGVEMLPGSRPYSFVRFKSCAAAADCLRCLDGTAIAAWGGKRVLLARVRVRGLPVFPPRPLADPVAAAAAIPGLSMRLDFVTADEELELLRAINSNSPAGPSDSSDPSDPKDHWQKLAQRRVQHHGFRFDYPANEVDRSAFDSLDPRPPLPLWTQPLLDRYASLFPLNNRPNQLTINHYIPGGGIAPHTDRHSSFLSPIVIISLGSGLVMEFRKAIDRSSDAIIACQSDQPTSRNNAEQAFVTHNVFLAPRSLVVLDKEARYCWEHAIRPRKMDLVDGKVIERRERFSLTFRNVRDKDAPPCDCGSTSLCD